MSTHNLKTLVEVLNDLKDQGYIVDFNFINDRLIALGSNKSYAAHEVVIKDQFRFEGETDPADASILYAVETKDGKKGTIVDAYGATSYTELEDFLKKAGNQ